MFSVSGPVLVTGGAGYIGSHVCKALAEAGAQPICLDTLEKGHDWAVRWGSLERGDVGDGRFVEDVFLRHKPQIVIHLAGYIEVGELVARPERYLSNNAAKKSRPGQCGAPAQGRGLRVLEHLRRLWPAAVGPAGRIASDRADQSLRRLEGKRRTRAGLGRLAWPARRIAALFQRHRRGRRSRDRRGSRPGNPSPASRGRRGPRSACLPRRARVRLSDG